MTCQKVKRVCLLTLCLLGLIPAAALADDSDWYGRVFTGEVTDLFSGPQPPGVIAFLKKYSDVASDARLYLAPCDSSISPDLLCDLNQARFVLDYVAAFYGDHGAQENIAYMLSGDGLPPKVVGLGDQEDGIAPDALWGCAWRMASITTGNSDTDMSDLDMYKVDCLSLNSDDQGQAEGTASGFLDPRIKALSSSKGFPFGLVDFYPQTP